MKGLNNCVGVLSLEKTSLSKQVAELEVDLVTVNTMKGELESGISWILSDGLNRFVDRLIECP